jgi:glycosyl transferase family 25
MSGFRPFGRTASIQAPPAKCSGFPLAQEKRGAKPSLRGEDDALNLAPLPGGVWKLQAFYINLATRTDRRAFMEAQLSALGMDVERLDATTPAAITTDDIAPLSMEEVCANLSPAEIACSVSHFRVWKRMLDEGQPRVLVLEDDVLLSPSLAAFLSAIEAADADIGILRLETRLTEVKIRSRRERAPIGFAFHLPLSFARGSGAYVMSAACASRILASPKRFAMPIDNILFSPKSPFYDKSRLRVVVPALALNRPETSPEFSVPASILAGNNMYNGNTNPTPPQPTGLSKILREGRRLRRQLYMKLFARTVVVPFSG